MFFQIWWYRIRLHDRRLGAQTQNKAVPPTINLCIQINHLMIYRPLFVFTNGIGSEKWIGWNRNILHESLFVYISLKFENSISDGFLMFYWNLSGAFPLCFGKSKIWYDDFSKCFKTCFAYKLCRIFRKKLLTERLLHFQCRTLYIIY